MINYMEVTGKTVEDAFTNAIYQLETTSDNIDYEVIEKGSSGIFGIGSRQAVIKVWRKDEAEAEKAKLQEKQEQPAKEIKEASVPKTAARENASKAESEKKVKAEAKVETKAENKNIDVEKVSKSCKDFLDNMFQAMGMEVRVDVTVDTSEGLVSIELSGEEMGLLIGKRGQTLDSIQYLVSIVVNKENDKYLRVKVDTENYRERRKETLESLAKNIAYKVKRSRRSVALEPMNPYERRIIHSALQGDKYVATRSEGEEPFRHVIVYLKNERRNG